MQRKQSITFAEEESVIRRYSQYLTTIKGESVDLSSIREGAAVIATRGFAGVKLSMLDMSSRSATGTFKDWVACVTIAACLESGVRELVTQTSGNTGNALGLYAAKQGVKVIILYPSRSRHKIDPDIARLDNVVFIEVEQAEPLIKDWTKQLSSDLKVPWLPAWDHQVEANKMRAYFLQDCCESTGEAFDWHAQALSSGYGVFGFYQGLGELANRGSNKLKIPRFLGVQQEAVAPYYEYLTGRPVAEKSADLIEPALFRTNITDDLLVKMKGVVEFSNGRICIVRRSEYERLKSQAQQILEEAGIRLSTVRTKEYENQIDRSGVLALVATLSQIESGLIASGESVLVCLTGGAGRDRPTIFEPELKISSEEKFEDLRRLVHRIPQN